VFGLVSMEFFGIVKCDSEVDGECDLISGNIKKSDMTTQNSSIDPLFFLLKNDLHSVCNILTAYMKISHRIRL
jgi:hypothetical protein